MRRRETRRACLRRLARAAAILAGGTLAAAGLAGAPAARAEFPDKPITLIVPWAPGGSTDQTARVLAKAAEPALGQPVVVVNKPGASTTIGMAELAKARPDGYTIGVLSSSAYLIPLQGRELPYDALKSFSYISYYGDNLIAIAVLADSPWQTLKDLVTASQSAGRSLKFGTGGVGTTQHLTTEALKLATGAKITHVPQQGSAGSMPALLGGHVDFITETSVWAPFVADGKVRLLAVTTPSRSPSYREVPTLRELGYTSLRSVQAILGPADLPEPIRARLEAAFRGALADNAFRDTMKRLSMEVIDLPGAQVKAMVADEVERARGLTAQLGIKAGN